MTNAPTMNAIIRASFVLSSPGGSYTGRVTRADLPDAIERFFRDRPAGVISAYLFGSHAQGRPHRQSDVDVGVLLDLGIHPTAAERFEHRVRLTSDLMGALGSAVDLIVLNDAPPQFARAILFGGRRVFCADQERDHEFLRTTMLRAADLEPFLRRVRRVKLNVIAR